VSLFSLLEIFKLRTRTDLRDRAARISSLVIHSH
jgi:hypothetical protein